jgi:conjugative transposon TraM protein
MRKISILFHQGREVLEINFNEMKTHSQKFIQKRKFYMALPVLVVPFMTMFFWALGGGKGAVAAKATETIGLNMKLPDAKFNEDELNAWDKLSLYQKARRDSLKVSQAKKSDPYFRLTTLKINQDTSKRNSKSTPGSVNTSLGERKEPLDETEAKVYKKLTELQREIDKPVSKSSKSKKTKTQSADVNSSAFQNDVDRLESMMIMMQNDPREDKEMEEINGVLNKILDVQHPERVKQRLDKAEKDNDDSFSTRPDGKQDEISLLGSYGSVNSLPGMEENRFYGLEESVSAAMETNAIQAEIYGNQNLVSGAVIKMELLQDVNINGVRIPKNQFVYGVCALNGERLTIKVSSIQYGSSIFPVSMNVYDIDGLEGIHVPGAIARDAAKKSSNQAIQDIQLSTLDPSIEVQAASAGIEAAKGMLSKKTRLIQVTVKAGYKVFLKDKNSQNSESK